MKNKILRGLALALSLVIVGLLFSFYCSFYGNPITKWMIRPQMIHYVENKYPDLDLTYESVSFNFKFGEYLMHVQSEEIEDLAFTVNYIHKEISDDYQSRVEEGWNTWQRLDSEYRDYIDPYLQAWNHNLELSYGTLYSKLDGTLPFTLDMQINFAKPPTVSQVVVWLPSDDQSVEFLAEQLLSLATFFKEKEIRIDMISMTLRYEANRMNEMGVYEFPTELILDNPNLINDLQDFIKKDIEATEKK